MDLIEWYVFWFLLTVATREIIKIFHDIILEIIQYKFQRISGKMLAIAIFNSVFDIIMAIGAFHLARYY